MCSCVAVYSVKICFLLLIFAKCFEMKSTKEKPQKDILQRQWQHRLLQHFLFFFFRCVFFLLFTVSIHFICLLCILNTEMLCSINLWVYMHFYYCFFLWFCSLFSFCCLFFRMFFFIHSHVCFFEIVCITLAISYNKYKFHFVFLCYPFISKFVVCLFKSLMQAHAFRVSSKRTKKKKIKTH